MTDIVDAKTRSRMMAGIKGKDTAPERFVQQQLDIYHIAYEAHRPDLPGKPDLILPLYKVAIMVNGCFWHQHQSCFYATTPSSQTDFWQKKLGDTVQRDQRDRAALETAGWRVITIWECGMKHCAERFAEVIDAIEGEMNLAEWPSPPPRRRTSQP